MTETITRERLLDPTGESDLATNTTLTPRLRSLRGLRLALLENTKPNGAVLLRHVGQQLQERYTAKATQTKKLLDTYTAILQPYQDMVQKIASTAAHGRIEARVMIPRGAPEMAYSVLRVNGDLIGTGLTQDGGYVRYEPIFGQDPEVEVLVGGKRVRVPVIAVAAEAVKSASAA